MRSLLEKIFGILMLPTELKITEYPLKGAGKQSRHSFMLSELTNLSRVSDRRQRPASATGGE